MQYLDNATLASLMDWPGLVEALEDAFIAGLEAPVRTQQEIPRSSGPAITLLTMPAHRSGHRFGIKCATVSPDNVRLDLPGVHAIYVLFDGDTGQPLATLEADQLTAWRTAAASALASRHLSREDASHLLLLGTGRMARTLIEAHAAVRPIETVSVWGRNSAKAHRLVEEFRDRPFEISTTESLSDTVPTADIVSCATMANESLFNGDWLRPGTHVDLVGAFRPDMRECDDTTMRRAEVHVDTMDGCLEEAGDLLASLESGAIAHGDIRGTLKELCRREVSGRRSPEDITLFKSVGTAIEDLAAAGWFLDRHRLSQRKAS